MPCHALLAGHTIPLCVVCIGFALQCRFCWAIFLENSGDVTRMIPGSDVNGCPSHKIPSHHNHIFVLYNRRSSRPAHGTEATTISGARPSGVAGSFSFTHYLGSYPISSGGKPHISPHGRIFAVLSDLSFSAEN